MKRRFEEVLEECLAVLASGQSTVEECLALHPGLAAELEPLLHTARNLQRAYEVDPSPLYAQAARERFLSAMAVRRQRRLTARPARPFWRWAPAALGSAALVTFAVWAGVLAVSGGGGSQEIAVVVNKIEPTSTPAPVVSDIQGKVERIKTQLKEIQTEAEKGPVEPAVIQHIQQMKEDTAALVDSLDQPEGLELEDVSQIDEVLANQEEVLNKVKESVPPEAVEDLDELIKIAGVGRAKVQQILLPTPTAVPSATPTAAPSATATPSATPTVTPEESPTATATPSETVTPEESPTEEIPEEPTPSPTPEAGEEAGLSATVVPYP